MATEKILGRVNASDSDLYLSNILLITRFQAAISGTAKEIKFEMTYGDTLSVVLYADSAGAPGVRLYVKHTTPCVGGWNTHTMDSTVEITAGNYYWLGAGGNSWRRYKNGTGTTKSKSWDWNTAPPDPAGTGFSDVSQEMTMELWGDAAAGGWANIAKVKGVASADIAKVKVVSVADIAKIKGISV